MLRQATNKVRIEGILSECNLKYGSFVRDGAPVENIGGNIEVLVRQEKNGETMLMKIPVYMFSTKYTKAGKVNPSYESIEHIMKDFVSIAAAGGEAGADKIRITSGEVRMNDYYNAQGQLVSYPRINASFVNKVTGDFRPEASFELEFAVSSINFVCDPDGVELDPKKLCIKAIVPQYGGRVDCVELFASAPGAVDAISQYWETGKTYHAKGIVNFVTTTTEVHEHNDFGEDDIKIRTSTISELLITKGTQASLDDDMAFAPSELQTALKERQARIEALKDKVATKSTPAPATSTNNAPFDLGF